MTNFANTPCKSSDISLKHTLNNNKLRDEDKKLVLDMLSVNRNVIDAKINVMRTDGVNYLSKACGSRSKGQEAGDLAITLLEKFKEVEQQNLLFLYQQKISWGVFNKNAQKYTADYESRLNAGLARIAERKNASRQTSVASSPARAYSAPSTAPRNNSSSGSAYTTQNRPAQPSLGDYFDYESESYRQATSDY